MSLNAVLAETKTGKGEGNYTYEGKIDPGTMTMWEQKRLVPMGNGYVEIEFINPAPTGIRIGLILVFLPTSKIHAFAYLEDGEPRVFVINKSNHYEPMVFESDSNKNRFRERLLRITNGAIA